ncbi:type VII secretion protein EccB [Micromonospora qiuiae]|uniref:Type VII secretion protein EccB n=1 Tax=Micromonospora qiuiae TaxID=502268 RepID=A0ABQ4JHX4_9ACTN|nr:type VII secretion protein EccB [Micromonospora qiuiae]GIJ29097.1 type VII secretion protein EccB [Micromonospora qiuiae]
MQTRGAQLRAYQFMVRRLTSALLYGRPNADNSLRRGVGAVFAGVMVCALMLAGWATIGLIGLTGPDWRDPNALIVDRDTGSRYVYREGLLHPVLNYASARLLLGAASEDVRWVRHSSLANERYGPPLGIRDAPDDVPRPAALIRLPWMICRASDPAGAVVSWAVLGEEPSWVNEPLADGVLVVAEEQLYLIWQGNRLKVVGESGAIRATLGWASVTALPLPEVFVNALPEGPDLVAPAIPGIGENGIPVAGQETRVGQLFEVQGIRGERQYYVLLRDGLAAIGGTVLGLLEATGLPGAYEPNVRIEPTEVAAAELSQVPTSTVNLQPPGMPDQPPTLARPDPRNTVLCARYAEGSGGQPMWTTHLSDATPVGPELRDSRAPEGVATVDWVQMSGGTGALLRTADGGVLLVNTQGQRFPVADRAAQVALGLGDVTPQLIPAGLADALPLGPTLSVLDADPPA